MEISKSIKRAASLTVAVTALTATQVASESGIKSNSIDRINSLKNAFVVSQGPAYETPNDEGCNGLSAFSTDSEIPQFQFGHIFSPGRLAAGPDLSTVVAINQNRLGNPFFALMHWNPENPSQTSISGTVGGDNFSISGGVAVGPDNDSLYVGVDQYQGYWTSKVRKYRLSEIRNAEVGPVRGELNIAPFEIVLTRDGKTAYLPTNGGKLYTVDTESMKQVGEPIEMNAYYVHGGRHKGVMSRVLHATLSPDERYFVANEWGLDWRGYDPVDGVDNSFLGLNVADVKTGDHWNLRVDDVMYTGGVAFNQASENRGLLTVHGGNNIIVFKFNGQEPLEELARAPIKPPRYVNDAICLPSAEPMQACYYAGPVASLAWTTDGTGIIAATDDFGEYRLYDVENGGRTIEKSRVFNACVDNDYSNFSGDIITANGHLAEPFVSVSDLYLPAALRNHLGSSGPTS